MAKRQVSSKNDRDSIRRKKLELFKQSNLNLQSKSEGVGKNFIIAGNRETPAQKLRRETRAKVRRNRIEYMNNDPNGSGFAIQETPSWFSSEQEHVDISIVVPLYKSREVIQKQIMEWDLTDDGLTKEIIYVDDKCPIQSHEVIVSTWEKRIPELKNKPVGKLVTSNCNRGYAGNCNLGSKFAKGKYIVFLNADVRVTSNWLRPMYDLLENDPTIGIVGNLHVQDRDSADKRIDSCGSQFSWQSGHFEHVGRTIYDGKRLRTTFLESNMPKDLHEIQDREMVTGACFMMPLSLFHEIEGYNEAYKIGYWEDSEMNMAVRHKGLKVVYTPKSMVYHVGGHSHAAGHKFIKDNKNHFYTKWIHTGIIDKIVTTPRPSDYPVKFPASNLKEFVKDEVIGCVIACNEDDFIEASIRSAAPMCNRFIVVLGGNQFAYEVGMCDEKGMPKDNTVDVVKQLATEFDIEIVLPTRLWSGKTEMRNAYANKLKHNQWMFMLDGDEVYKEGNLWQLAMIMKRYEILNINFHLFWNNMNTLGIGAWENYQQERLVKWKDGYHYKEPNHLYVADSHGPMQAKVPTYHSNEKFFYHYSWVRPLEKIKQKLEYYKLQLKHEWSQPNAIKDDYFENVFLKWRTNPSEVEYTHPRGGGSACNFGGLHPYIINKMMSEGKFNY